MRVIIFEDNFILAMTLKLMIKQLKGDTIACYDSADDLISLFEKEYIDCILMDIQLNGKKTGLEAVEELRKYSEIPVIFLSGNSTSDLLNKIKSISNTTLISKPYTENNLKEKFIELSLLN